MSKPEETVRDLMAELMRSVDEAKQRRLNPAPASEKDTDLSTDPTTGDNDV